MLRQHQANNIAPVFSYSVGIGPDNHALSGGRYTRSDETAGFFIFHDTETTGTCRFELRMITEIGDLYAVGFGNGQQAGTLSAINNLSING